ncbi:hypothetical protein [Azospirillum halopraeferens]|uniref:hypothetical protein n=1 Tax=Azospirillum halopraeferens TaxID=34010 RepID=UPI000417D684|nr:hypothetical protein [Azospirillum halopraeferens]
MRRTSVSLATLALLLAGPALAQTDTMPSSDPVFTPDAGASSGMTGDPAAGATGDNGSDLTTGATDPADDDMDSAAATGTGGATGATGAGATGAGATGAGATAMTQDRLRQTMEQAGFQDIEVIDAAYLVQARTQDGDTVYMVVNPPPTAAGGSGSGMDSGAGRSESPSATTPPTGGTTGQGGNQ